MEYYAKHIVDAGYRIHKELGPGLRESVFKEGIHLYVKKY
jgi:hypothetical protein